MVSLLDFMHQSEKTLSLIIYILTNPKHFNILDDTSTSLFNEFFRLLKKDLPAQVIFIYTPMSVILTVQNGY